MGVINLSILVKKIMGKISGAGYIKDTDYASSTKGGTIKIDSTYATDITSGGKLKAKEITAEAYSEANDAAFISKATLDNVLVGVGGITFDKLFDGSVTKGSSTASQLAHPFTGYKWLSVTLIGTNYHRYNGDVIVSTITESNYRFQMIDSSYMAFILDDTNDTFKIEGSGTATIVIYGIK